MGGEKICRYLENVGIDGICFITQLSDGGNLNMIYCESKAAKLVTSSGQQVYTYPPFLIGLRFLLVQPVS